jgi:FkbM family methyltransferase
LEGFEAETTWVFRGLARQSRVFLDIGANTGFFSLLACAENPSINVIAFEPVPRVFDRLNLNISLNHWEDRCQLSKKAVSDHSGMVSFYVPIDGVPRHARIKGSADLGVKCETIEVSMTTIDEAVRNVGEIDLVKIDVERAEDCVLRGMTKTLQESGPIIFIECVPRGPIDEVQSILKSFGYRFFQLDEHGPRLVSKITPDPTQKYRNYLCALERDIEKILEIAPEDG